MINNWWLWGLGWLIVPRMTIGVMLGVLTSHTNLAIALGFIGLLLDFSSSGDI